ncbi:hypothetical protein B484DRAFT_451016 [Ochromonadaceae sp. CCMP2298]|nr:hypothetical protein B484DRAFT_451016 [Ochromonadaceae sp. CCMP2298]
MDAPCPPPSTKALQPSDPGSAHRRLRQLHKGHMVGAHAGGASRVAQKEAILQGLRAQGKQAR